MASNRFQRPASSVNQPVPRQSVPPGLAEGGWAEPSTGQRQDTAPASMAPTAEGPAYTEHCAKLPAAQSAIDMASSPNPRGQEVPRDRALPLPSTSHAEPFGQTHCLPRASDYVTHYSRPTYLDIRVHATPYAYTANREPLFIQFGTGAAETAAQAVASIGSDYTYAPTFEHEGLDGRIGYAPLYSPGRYRLFRGGEGGSAFHLAPRDGEAGSSVVERAATDPRDLLESQSIGRCKQRVTEAGDEGVEKPGGSGRITWTEELHREFLRAVDVIGVERAVPMAILKRMRVKGLTREQVASHLQKHRSTLKRAREERVKELLVRAAAKGVLGEAAQATEDEVIEAVREEHERGEEKKRRRRMLKPVGKVEGSGKKPRRYLAKHS